MDVWRGRVVGAGWVYEGEALSGQGVGVWNLDERRVRRVVAVE